MPKRCCVTHEVRKNRQLSLDGHVFLGLLSFQPKEPTMKNITIICSLIAGLLAVSPLSARTQAIQSSISPQEVLDQLMAGNERFTAGVATNRDYLSEAAETASGQYPLAVIVSCLDSRVPVEIVFDQGIGDVFVGRVAGNVEDTDMIGSLEFATKVAGSKLVMVLGHEACGAVKGAIADVELGNLTQLLEKIKPAIEAVDGFEGQRDTKHTEFVDAVISANVVQTVSDLRARSAVLADLEKAGDIMIVGGVYSLDDGKVTLIDTAHGHAH
jgi:carbonic anhydrase